MEYLRTGVIGLGLMGFRHARVYAQLPYTKLVAVADADKARAEQVGEELGAASYADYRELLQRSDIEAVSICLPDPLHCQATLEAIRWGKHILLEKPITTDLGEAEKIKGAAEKSGVILCVGHILRFDPRFAMARNYIKNGQVGKIQFMVARRNSPITGPKHYQGRADLATHVMVHDVDILNWFAGDYPIEVCAWGSKKQWGSFGMYDWIHATLVYNDDLKAFCEATWTLPEKSPSDIDGKVEVVGTEGVIYIDTYNQGLTLVNSEGAHHPDTMHWPSVGKEIWGDILNEILHFLTCVLSGSRPLVGPHEACESLRVALAIMESVETGKVVRIRD